MLPRFAILSIATALICVGTSIAGDAASLGGRGRRRHRRLRQRPLRLGAHRARNLRRNQRCDIARNTRAYAHQSGRYG